MGNSEWASSLYSCEIDFLSNCQAHNSGFLGSRISAETPTSNLHFLLFNIMALTESQIQELYVAYFGRPADVEGKAYWSGSSTGVTTVLGFAANMHSQSEFQDAYGSKKTATQ